MKAARADKHKLKTRLSKGEQRNSKRTAELAVVYDATSLPRTPSDVFARADDGKNAPALLAKAKWRTADVVPTRRRSSLPPSTRKSAGTPSSDVHGSHSSTVRRTRSTPIRPEARRSSAKVAVAVDFIHVLEHLWGAAWCFFDGGEPAAEAWVAEKGLALLSWNAGLAAGAIARKATALGFDGPRRKKADECVRYLEVQRIGSDAGDQRLRQSMSLAVSKKTTARAN